MLIDELINLTEIIAKRAEFYQKDYNSKNSVRFRFNTGDKVYINYDNFGLIKRPKITTIRRGWVCTDLGCLELSLIDNEYNDTLIHVFRDITPEAPEWKTWKNMPMPKANDKTLYNNLLSIIWDNCTKSKKK